MKSYNRLERKIAMDDDENRWVFVTYSRDENRKILPLYEKFAQKYPFGRMMIERMKGVRDPIEDMKQAGIVLQQVKELKEMIESLGFMGEEDEMAGRIKIMLRHVDPLYKTYSITREIYENFYMNIVEETKKLAAEKNVKAEDVVRQQDCLDEVMRRIFETREEAEKFDEVYRKMHENMAKIGNTMMDIGTGTDLAEMAKKLSESGLMPTEEEDKALKESIRELKRKELDRIYGEKK